MSLIPIFFLATCIVILVHQNNKDPGKHKKAKIWHSIAAILFILASSRAISIRNIFHLIEFFTEIGNDSLSNSPSGSPDHFRWILFISIINIISCLSCIALLFRIDFVRKLFLVMIVIVAFANVLTHPFINLPGLTSIDGNPLASFIIIILIYFSISTGYIYLYTRPFMVDFFRNKKPYPISPDDALDGGLLK